PALLGGATRVGIFDERQWGISVSAVKADRSADDDGDDTDFWLALPGFRDSLIAAEADHGAGRTFSEEEIYAYVGLPQRDTDQEELRRRCMAHGKWMSDHPEAMASAEEWADGNLDELDHT
ncbi:hypothetical protein, partial [Mycobacterium intracellulare]